MRARHVRHAWLLAFAWAATGACATDAPRIAFADPASDAVFGKAYRMALDNVLRVNDVVADDAHRRSGLLQGDPPHMIRAGGGYPAAWTRDASINSWNAVSLLAPALARNTLFAVIDPLEGGHVVRQDDQQWDQAIWVVAAWHHYLVTGDRAFLAIAYDTATRTLAVHRRKAFDAASGLFLGGSVINDGISGYPEPVADAGESKGSFVGDYPAAATIAALSTNLIHYAAYDRAAKMARALGRPAREAHALARQADALRGAIDARFWDERKQRYAYLYAPRLDLETRDSQEGLGVSFALMFGVAQGPRADALIAHAVVATWGIEDVTPAFRRYDAAHPGRHNAIVWPMTQGFWGTALAAHGTPRAFGDLLEKQARLALRSGGFWEIYNGATGEVDGGWQVGRHWPAEGDQTWSATAYLRLVDEGLFGLHPEEDGLRIAPVLPPGMGDVTLSGLRYRSATLDVTLTGEGRRVRHCTFDGGACPSRVAPGTTGRHQVRIELGD